MHRRESARHKGTSATGSSYSRSLDATVAGARPNPTCGSPTSSTSSGTSSACMLRQKSAGTEEQKRTRKTTTRPSCDAPMPPVGRILEKQTTTTSHPLSSSSSSSLFGAQVNTTSRQLGREEEKVAEKTALSRGQAGRRRTRASRRASGGTESESESDQPSGGDIRPPLELMANKSSKTSDSTWARRSMDTSEGGPKARHYYSIGRHSNQILLNNRQQQQQQQQANYLAHQLDSLASSQRTNETCDESPVMSQTDESATRLAAGRQHPLPAEQNHYHSPGTNFSSDTDYHYYQVLVPANQEQPSSGLTSPCKSIQRMVGALFAGQQPQACPVQEQSHHRQEPITTINETLVSNEPLIRSSSWQNKTLIDLRHQHQAQAVHYLESSLSQKTLPPASNRQQQQQQQLATMDRYRQPELPGAGGQFHQFHQHLYHERAPELEALRARVQPLPGLAGAGGECLKGDAFLQRSFQALSSGSNSEYERRHFYHLQANSSHQAKLSPRRQANNWPAALWRSNRLCLLLFLLSAFLAGLALLALLSNYGPTGDKADLAPQIEQPARVPIGAHEQSGGNSQQSSLYTRLSQLAARAGNLTPSIGGPPWPPSPSPPPLPPNELPPLRWPLAGPPDTPKPVILPARPADTPILQSEHGATGQWPAVTTGAPTARPSTAEPEPSPSTQSYWAKSSGTQDAAWLTCDTLAECNSKGLCLDEASSGSGPSCACYAGFSGPTCALANCPNDCSGRGECRLRSDSTINGLGAAQSDVSSRGPAHLQTFAFQTLTSSLARNSVCPQRLERELNRTWAVREVPHSSLVGSRSSSAASLVYDQRLEWQCQCEPGFTGSDCSLAQELECDDQRDNDADGLVDCEDDDCCSQPACRDNLMCFKSPEPRRVLAGSRHKLEPGRGDTGSGRFYAHLSFLIANESVQSYAQERAFEPGRAAVVRGKVSKWRPSAASGPTGAQPRPGIVGVRVSVLESAQFGFSLTRNDGFFDLLVNGNEWITLQFHRNAYVPIKRKLFVRARSINMLPEEVEMWLAGGSGASASGASSSANGAGGSGARDAAQQSAPLDSAPFNLQPRLELLKLVNLVRRDDERRRAQLFECLLSGLAQRAHLPAAASAYEPQLVLEPRGSLEPLKTLVTADSGAFQLELGAANLARQNLKILYNSAAFPPAASVVKATVNIQLLPARLTAQLQPHPSAVILQLDIEGQSSRERLVPLAGLSYQFAWNRRNVYEQKVYGFAQLTVRVGYEYSLAGNETTSWSASCLADDAFTGAAGAHERTKVSGHLAASLASLERRVIWFERKLYLEAHQLNQQADIGKWNLANLNRHDRDRELIYMAAGWTLPYKLIYPPVVSEPIYLGQRSSGHQAALESAHPMANKLMARGPNSSVFLVLHAGDEQGAKKSTALPQASLNNWHSNGLEISNNGARLIQLDSTGKRALLDVPLSILSSKFGEQQQQQPSNDPHSYNGSNDQAPKWAPAEDVQLIYNNYLSTLYLSSRQAGKIVQVSYSSLLALNRTLSSRSATAAADDEIDIEPLCGFGRHSLGSSSSTVDSLRPSRSLRLTGPHSMALDEERQVLYFLDGTAALVALDLASHQAALMAEWRPATQAQSRASDEAARARARHLAASGGCNRAEASLALADYRPHRPHNLIWSRADSSLYFVDHNLVLALRQDMRLELVAVGERRPGVQQSRHSLPLPAACFAAAKGGQLGSIRALAVDESENELLVVHQWTAGGDNDSQANEQAKVNGQLYLAKVRLGFRSHTNSDGLAQVIDLHSSSSAWDPMIWSAAGGQAKLPSGGGLDWAKLSQQFEGQHEAAGASGAQGSQWPGGKRIPFIHLSGGFARIDSIEINSDGSIFVLDSDAHSITLVAPYSMAEFNLVERRDVNINRLFADPKQANAGGRGEAITDGPSRRAPELDGLSELKPLGASLLVHDPISTDLMEFHLASGLQLSLTSAAPAAANGLKSEFYYRLFSNNKMAEPDEDDKYDFDAHTLIASLRQTKEAIARSDREPSSEIENLYIRLDRISQDFTNSDTDEPKINRAINHFELVRLYSGSRFVLQSILNNQQPVYELLTDYMGVLSTFQQPGDDTWIEMTYDSQTCLLRDVVKKVEAGQLSGPGFTSQNGNKDWKQLKRIVYDRLFYHYCDQFIVNA